MSAFCLALPLLKLRPEEFRWLSYLGKRAWRIYPAHIVALTILILVSGSLDMRGVVAPYTPVRGFRHSMSYPLIHYSVGFSYNICLGTLITEVRWYLLLPLMVAGLWRFGARA